MYVDLYNNRLEERRLAASSASNAPEQTTGVADTDARSIGGFGGQRSILHPKFLQAAFSVGGKLPSKAEMAADTKEFAVEQPDIGELLGGDITIDACAHNGRNVCKHHPAFARISALQAALSTLCDRLGKSVVSTGDILLLLEGVVPEGALVPPERVFALISAVSFSPKFQDFVLCRPKLSAMVGQDALQLPLHVSLGLAPFPLEIPGVGGGAGLHHKTSSELCEDLCGQAPEWRIRVCKYQILSPMQMLVKGFEGSAELDVLCKLDAAGRRTGPRRRPAPAEVTAALALNDLGDPVRQGAQSALFLPLQQDIGNPGAAAAQEGQGAADAADDNAAEVDQSDAERTEDEPGAADTTSAAPLALLEEPPLVDIALRDLSAGILIEAVEREDLMAPELCLDADEPLQDSLGPATVANKTAASGKQSPSVASSAAPAGTSAASAVATLDGVLDLAAALADILDEPEATTSANTTTTSGSGLASSSTDGPSAASEGHAMEPPPIAAAPPAVVAPALGAAIPDGPTGWTMTATFSATQAATGGGSPCSGRMCL